MNFKTISHKNMNIYIQAIQDVDEFSKKQSSLAQQWIICSEWVPSEWESKHHNNPHVTFWSHFCKKQTQDI